MTTKTQDKQIDELYGISFRTVIDRLKYKGHGRPRKTDYITFEEAQMRVNKLYNLHLDSLKLDKFPKYLLQSK